MQWIMTVTSMGEVVVLVPILALALGCAHERRLDQLEQRVAALEAANAQGTATPAVDPNEDLAQELFGRANDAALAGDYDTALALLQELEQKYPNTRSNTRAGRLRDELVIIGADAGEFEVEHWFQGQPAMADGRVTLLVFFETWCPHCQREVPKLEAIWQTHKPSGLSVVALTKITKGKTFADVEAFIQEHGLTYPVGKERDGAMSARFNVSGIPAAAAVRDGKVIWRGHPARITDEMLRSWLEGAP